MNELQKQIKETLEEAKGDWWDPKTYGWEKNQPQQTPEDIGGESDEWNIKEPEERTLEVVKAEFKEVVAQYYKTKRALSAELKDSELYKSLVNAKASALKLRKEIAEMSQKQKG